MSAPTRRVKLPESDRLYRAGKIRLGEAVATGKTTSWGDAITRPVKLDYFRVDAEDGVTNPAAAAAFHELYGEQPREIRVMLPGETVDSVLEGAWRLYGSNKLKRICDRSVDAVDEEVDPDAKCDQRTDTGGWERGIPCVCQRQGLIGTKKGCALRYTLQVVLPDLPLYGAWQVDTGSVISIRNLMSVLPMLQALRGTLLWAELVLRLTAVTVQPQGRAQTSTVYVLDPQIAGDTDEIRPGTLRALMAGQHRAIAAAGGAPALPPPALDDEPDDLIDHPNRDGAAETAAEVAAAHVDAETAATAAAIAEQVEQLSKPDLQRFAGWCKAEGLQNYDQVAGRLGPAARTNLLDCLPSVPASAPPAATRPEESAAAGGAAAAGTAAVSTAAGEAPAPTREPPAADPDPTPAGQARVVSYSKVNPDERDVAAWMSALSEGKLEQLRAICQNIGRRCLPSELLSHFGPDDVGDVFAALVDTDAPPRDPAADAFQRDIVDPMDRAADAQMAAEAERIAAEAQGTLA